MSSHINVTATIGAALAGCMISVGSDSSLFQPTILMDVRRLSAILGFQTFLYFQIFPSDQFRYKALVGWIWITDAVHTILICTAIWEFAINNFGNSGVVDTIFPTLAATVAITAITTLSVNIFYGWRIHKMSRHNWWLTGPIALLCVARVALAFTTTVEMILTKKFSVFAAGFKLLLTCGLAVSALTDIVVSAARYYYLRSLKQGYMLTQEVVDAVVVFTINDGCLTCGVVIASIACLLRMPNNFVWLGIYFTIAKFYSNSVLATLNLRNWYRHRPMRPVPIGIPMARTPGINGVLSNSGTTGDKGGGSPSDGHGMPTRMEVFIDHQVEYNVGGLVARDDFDHDGDSHSRSSRKSMNIA
ncbi:hypothetical protein B0H11DRAFT_2241964 [Mycena galericulata]|nr:hypothetical protein B0H11DRAFT_2241964 [Mycena galericulata]